MALPQTQLDELQWRSPEWINSFGLRTDNVLEYFSQSPFFDRTSNNQVIKMQNQFNNPQFMNMPYEQLLNELKKMKGIEFVISLVKEPDFWIIKKQNRLSESEVISISNYYIIGSSVYMAPLIHSIMSSRLLSTAYNLREAMSILQKLPDFSPGEGHVYNITPKTNTNDTAKQIQDTQEEDQEVSKIPNSSAGAFINLLNLSMTNNSIYLDDIEVVESNQALSTAGGITSGAQTRGNSQPPI